MIAIETRGMTVDDYRKLPEDDWCYQLIEGEIIRAPAPNFFHQRILGNIFRMRAERAENEDLGQAGLAPLDFYLDDHNVYQPDVLFISRAREGIIHEDGLDGAPDFVAEILSPRTARYDLNGKRAGYARSGVREMWLVYPEAKRVDVFHLEKNAETPAASYSLGQNFSSPLFSGLEISINKVFAR